MYSIEVYDSEELEPIVNLARACYGEAGEPLEYWRWRYRSEYPTQSAIIVARSGNKIVGMQPMNIFPAVLGGRQEYLGVLTGVQVHPDHRGHGLFGGMVDACVQEAWKSKAIAVTTMPNERSFPLFMRKGWTNSGDRPFFVRPLRRGKWNTPAGVFFSWVAACAAVLWAPEARARWSRRSSVHYFTSTIEDTIDTGNLESVDEDERISISRDGNWLRWRYADCPIRDYSLLKCANKEGRIAGWAASAVEWRAGLRVGYVMDVVAGNVDARTTLVRAAVDALASQGVAAACAVVSSPLQKTSLETAGFAKVPEFMPLKRFHTVHVVNPARETESALVETVDRWNLTLGDWDAI